MNYDHRMWPVLQALKLRVLDHANKPGQSWEQQQYWWAHYFKLDILQKSLISEPQ